MSCIHKLLSGGLGDLWWRRHSPENPIPKARWTTCGWGAAARHQGGPNLTTAQAGNHSLRLAMERSPSIRTRSCEEYGRILWADEDLDDKLRD